MAECKHVNRGHAPGIGEYCLDCDAGDNLTGVKIEIVDGRTGRARRTDDGTYPNVEEEMAKVEERARAAEVNPDVIMWGGSPHIKGHCPLNKRCLACERLGYHLQPVAIVDADTRQAEAMGIISAHPMSTRRFDLYEQATRLVGERHAKGELIDLVNWLLYRLDQAEKMKS